MAELTGKTVLLKDWDGRKTGDWGVVKEYDGEYFWIAFTGDENDVKPYTRDEFIVPRGNNVSVDTSRYERAYGTKPRGYGWWLFSDGYDDPRLSPTKKHESLWVCERNYSEAKRRAIEWAKRMGIKTLYLES